MIVGTLTITHFSLSWLTRLSASSDTLKRLSTPVISKRSRTSKCEVANTPWTQLLANRLMLRLKSPSIRRRRPQVRGWVRCIMANNLSKIVRQDAPLEHVVVLRMPTTVRIRDVIAGRRPNPNATSLGLKQDHLEDRSDVVI